LSSRMTHFIAKTCIPEKQQAEILFEK